MKNYLFLLIAFAIVMTSCKKNDNPPTPVGKTTNVDCTFGVMLPMMANSGTIDYTVPTYVKAFDVTAVCNEKFTAENSFDFKDSENETGEFTLKDIYIGNNKFTGKLKTEGTDKNLVVTERNEDESVKWPAIKGFFNDVQQDRVIKEDGTVEGDPLNFAFALKNGVLRLTLESNKDFNVMYHFYDKDNIYTKIPIEGSVEGMIKLDSWNTLYTNAVTVSANSDNKYVVFNAEDITDGKTIGVIIEHWMGEEKKDTKVEEALFIEIKKGVLQEKIVKYDTEAPQMVDVSAASIVIEDFTEEEEEVISR